MSFDVFKQRYSSLKDLAMLVPLLNIKLPMSQYKVAIMAAEART